MRYTAAMSNHEDDKPEVETNGSTEDALAAEPKDARAIIMARRQFFITSALAGVALAGCDRKGPNDVPPHVCLKTTEPDPPSTASAHPVPAAAEPAPPSPSSSSSAPQPVPTVCLEMPEPTVCLNMVPVDDDGAG